MKHLTHRNAAASGFGLVAVGVGLVLVPGANAAHPAVANTAANVGPGITPSSAANVPPMPLATGSSATSLPAAAPSHSPAAPANPPTSPLAPVGTPFSTTTVPGIFGKPTSGPSTVMSTRPGAPNPTSTKPVPPPGHPTSGTPTPAPTTSAAPPTNPGMFLNIGDQLAIGVAGSNTADGSFMVAWHPDPNVTDQHWTLNYAKVGDIGGITFNSNMVSSSVMDLDTANSEINLWHSLTGTNQLWTFDAGTSNQNSYIRNIATNGCLTDHGLGAQLTVTPCKTGDVAQLWHAT